MKHLGSKDAGGTLMGGDAPMEEHLPRLHLMDDEVEALGPAGEVGDEREMRAKVRVAGLSKNSDGSKSLTLEFISAEFTDPQSPEERAYPSMKE